MQDVYCPLDPAEHGADLFADDLDGVAVDGIALLEEPPVVVAAVVRELLEELAVFDEGRARLDTPDPAGSLGELAADDVAGVLGGAYDGVDVLE